MCWLQVVLVLLGGGSDNNRLSSSATCHLHTQMSIYTKFLKPAFYTFPVLDITTGLWVYAVPSTHVTVEKLDVNDYCSALG
jgi:hypothetical protein